VAGQALLELGLEAVAGPFRRRRETNRVVAAVGLLGLGLAAGALTSLVLPSPILGLGLVPGLSLVVSPLACGVVLQAYGRYRLARGGDPSFLATFWGGALFAFGMALARFWLVGRFR
jgi:hypothetical protein